MTFPVGARILVTDGLHLGRHGHIALTHTSPHTIIVKMLGLHAGTVRVVLDRTEEGGWSGILPVEALVLTRPENDAELYLRIADAYGQWGSFLGHALDCGGQAMDDAAKYLGLQRGEVAISETEESSAGFTKR